MMNLSILLRLFVLVVPIVCGEGDQNIILYDDFEGSSVLGWARINVNVDYCIGRPGFNSNYSLVTMFTGPGDGYLVSNYVSLSKNWGLEFYTFYVPGSVAVTGSGYFTYIAVQSPNGSMVIGLAGRYSSDGIHFQFIARVKIDNIVKTAVYEGPKSSYKPSHWLHIKIMNTDKLYITIYRVDGDNEIRILSINTSRLETPSIRFKIYRQWNFHGKVYLDKLKIYSISIIDKSAMLNTLETHYRYMKYTNQVIIVGIGFLALLALTIGFLAKKR